MLHPGDFLGTYEASAGHLCLDFANTIDWRTSSQPDDRLASYTHLVAWGLLVNILTEDEAQDLIRKAAEKPQAASMVLERAVLLRETIYRVFSAASRDLPADPVDLSILNSEINIAFKHLRITSTHNQFMWVWERNSDTFDRILWPVARSSADLLVSNELSRVGECQGEGCGWLYIDTSKNHSRRWCNMNDCGNREKARQHYKRKRKIMAVEKIPAMNEL
jgi:predicted RNA-binding Zn ribbon-like protein